MSSRMPSPGKGKTIFFTPAPGPAQKARGGRTGDGPTGRPTGWMEQRKRTKKRNVSFASETLRRRKESRTLVKRIKDEKEWQALAAALFGGL